MKEISRSGVTTNSRIEETDVEINQITSREAKTSQINILHQGESSSKNEMNKIDEVAIKDMKTQNV